MREEMASQVIPAEAIDAAAAMYDAIAYGANWESLNDYQKESRRRDVELILEAAAPHILAECWDAAYEKGCDRGEWEAAPVREEPTYANPYRSDK